MENNNISSNNLESKAYPKTSDWSDLAEKVNTSKPRKSKKGLKILVVILITISLILGSLFVYFKFIKADSEKVYFGIISDFEKELKESINDKDEDAGILTIHSNMKDYKIFNKVSLEYSYKKENDSSLASLNYKEDDKSLLSANVYIKDGKIYIDSKDFYRKPLLITDSSVEITPSSDADNNYIMDKTGTYFNKALKSAEFKTEYGKIEVNSKKVFVQKNILNINKNNAEKIKNEFLNNIKMDSKYIEILAKTSNQTKASVISELDEFISESVDMDNLNIEIDTNLFTNKFLKANIKQKNENILNVELVSSDTYNVTLYDEGKSYEGVVTETDNSLNIKTSIEDYAYNITLEEGKDSDNIRVKVTDKGGKYFTIDVTNSDKDINIKDVNTKKAVDTSKLSDGEVEKISNNLSKIIESSKVLSSFMD